MQVNAFFYSFNVFVAYYFTVKSSDMTVQYASILYAVRSTPAVMGPPSVVLSRDRFLSPIYDGRGRYE